ncbi:hypothetical protein [Xylella fastidiosa]|uniref:Uncharacterized protein n=1 Tax=Xylella fastidiosa (strain 9a5c) TaxID=160492 RepID=Q9PHC3_XYLFA|nr:hypothetical protein [Xylella fastidiosa]AAF82834.1 hypothetical protein XF_0021 [Xylella fastidiosa 9a5c]MDG5823215.1 hypothetical protein [Xylella fastidiosa subsp. pauca]WGZ32105.1 hypothetical protein O4444_00085 [Xylella fastidiosa subsp. pauca]WGZ36664.1 hypothetical protein O4443_00085 [Xylella fastidiosa subsp. pauca]
MPPPSNRVRFFSASVIVPSCRVVSDGLRSVVPQLLFADQKGHVTSDHMMRVSLSLFKAVGHIVGQRQRCDHRSVFLLTGIVTALLALQGVVWVAEIFR